MWWEPQHKVWGWGAAFGLLALCLNICGLESEAAFTLNRKSASSLGVYMGIICLLPVLLWLKNFRTWVEIFIHRQPKANQLQYPTNVFWCGLVALPDRIK